jgi:hypothetical protein
MRRTVISISQVCIRRSDNLPSTTPSCSLRSRKRAKSEPKADFGEPGEGAATSGCEAGGATPDSGGSETGGKKAAAGGGGALCR